MEATLLRARKSEIVDGLRGVFSDAGVVVVAHYKGLSVAEVSEHEFMLEATGDG